MIHSYEELCMKWIILILFPINVFSMDLVYQYDKNTSKKIVITNFHGMNASESCVKNAKDCSKLIDKKKIKLEKIPGLKGDPASNSCEEIGGLPAILKDSKFNDYEYCLLGKDYFVDSWDLHERHSK